MKHTSPLTSQAHQTLKTLAAEAGFAEVNIRRFFWLINAHDQLIAFIQICKNLNEVLAALRQLPEFTLADYGIEDWPALTNWVVESREALCAAAHSTDIDRQPSKPKDHPVLNRGAIRHSLYTALWSRHEDPQSGEKFALIIGHLLLAHIRLMQNHVPLDRYEHYSGLKALPPFSSSLYHASLAIRELSTLDGVLALELIDPYVSPETFANDLCLVSFRELDINHRLRTMGLKQCIPRKMVLSLASVSNFIPIPYGFKQGRKRSKGVGSGGSQRVTGYVYPADGRQFFIEALGDADDPADDWGTGEWIRELPQVSKLPVDTMVRDLDRDDIDPAELADDQELYLANSASDLLQKGLAGIATSARGQARHVRKANQMLPCAYDVLTQTELAKLTRFLRARFQALSPKGKWSDDDELIAESIALLHIMLWTGSKLARARSLKVITDENEDADLGLYCSADKAGNEIREWRIRGFFPQYRTRITAPERFVRRRTQYCWLPDIAGGSRFVEALSFPRKDRAYRVFSKTTSRYRKSIKAILQEADETKRITIGKLERYLFNRIARGTGDVTEAAVLTGQSHRLAQTRIFYTTPNIKSLRELYVRTVNEILPSLPATKDGVVNLNPAATDFETLHVGSRLCATVDAVKMAIFALQQDLKSASRYDSFTQFSRYHNLLTLYTVLMVAYGVAFRAVVKPFIASDLIDPETHLTAIADKVGEDLNKSRLAWVPPSVLQQIQHYEDHCAAFLSGHGGWSTTTRLEADGELSCFLIKERQKTVLEEVRPTTLKPWLSAYLPLPANAQRRFLRTELRARGCPSESVDALLGHWCLGEEPFGRFSSFPFSDHVSVLKKFLCPLLSELGWRPIGSALISKGGVQ